MTAHRTCVKCLVILALPAFFVTSCNKADFLEKKPNTYIIVPESLEDYQKLLDGNHMNHLSAGLAEMASDDYVVDRSDWLSASPVQRNSYIWAADIYEGTTDIRDWQRPYQAIFYVNNVLSGLDQLDDKRTIMAGHIRGQALFKRAFAYYELARNFCKPYDALTADSDLGLPLRLKPGVDYVTQRASLAETYDRVFSDLNESITLLSTERSQDNLFRPWRGAAYALLARIYLDMRQYEFAELYADSCLTLHDELINYNTLNRESDIPFSITNDELIYAAMTFGVYNFTANTQSSPARASEELLDLYEPGDLRFPLFFAEDANGKFWKKRGKGGQPYPFTGLATDEIYLIKAECLARRNEVLSAISVLNTLRRNRFDSSASLVEVSALDADDALQHVLDERRRELVWRCLRWQDIKRLNMEGAGITLVKTLDDDRYELTPNHDRYVFPIPDEEIIQSGIAQNER